MPALQDMTSSSDTGKGGIVGEEGECEVQVVSLLATLLPFICLSSCQKRTLEGLDVAHDIFIDGHLFSHPNLTH